MGKQRSKAAAAKHDPLDEQLRADRMVTKQRKRAQRRGKAGAAEEEAKGDDGYLPARLSEQILKHAREQAAAVEEEEERGATAAAGVEDEEAGSDAESGSEIDETVEEGAFAPEFAVAGLSDEAGLSAEDAHLAAFMGSGPAGGSRNLADIIMAKIKEKEMEASGAASEGTAATASTMNPKVIKVYRTVGRLLSKYRSGRLPKAFKIVPSLGNWESVLVLTNPEGWTAAAMYQATRIFASNLNARMAQRFFNLVLLPRVREEIAERKKLSFHLYASLKKALYKPEAWFRGILLPLCESRTCTIQEANILGSLLAKTSIPVVHSAAAMLKITQLPYSGASSLFLRILIDKKYALPYMVIDHFAGFESEQRRMPVIWHQSLLSFVQRYKAELTVEQKNRLKPVLRAQSHWMITPEVRRELFSAPCRGEGADAGGMDEEEL